MIAELQSALDEIEKTHTRVVILTGAGKAFCAGIDLDILRAIGRQTAGGEQEDSKRIAKMFRKIWSYSRPLIAAVNGHALAGGCGIATLCDFTLAVPEAKFGYTEVKIWFFAGDCVCVLDAADWEKRARDLLLTGRLVEATEAKELGMVNELVPPENLMARAHELAETILAASPSSVTRAKHLLVSAAAAGVDHDLERAVLESAGVRCTPDFKEGLERFLKSVSPCGMERAGKRVGSRELVVSELGSDVPPAAHGGSILFCGSRPSTNLI